MESESLNLPDDVQQVWRSQSPHLKIAIDASLLVKELQHSSRNLAMMACYRDFREMVVAALLVPLWLYLGVRLSLPWTWYLTVPALLWVAGFLLYERVRSRRNASGLVESLSDAVKQSLTQVEHQIILLRNVFWWYILPFVISITAYFLQVLWALLRQPSFESTLFILGYIATTFIVFGFIQYLNKRVVETTLEPRKKELCELLANLTEKPGS